MLFKNVHGLLIMICCAVCMSTSLFAQNPDRHPNEGIGCGTEEVMQSFYARNPLEKAAAEQFNRMVRNNPGLQKQQVAQYTIPVVVHVFGTEFNSGMTVNDALIIDALKRTNEDFTGLAPDWDGISSAFSPIKATLDIEFAFAKLDPNGNPTTGITYNPVKKGFGHDSGYDAEIQKYAWDNYKYFNIYIMRDLYDDGDYFNSGVGWYPSTSMSDNNLARIVYNGSYLGNNTNENFRSVLTHEFGHYLNLAHTFNNGCSSPGDNVDDTPYTTSNSGSCNYTNEKCAGAGPPNGENFMDYTDCYSMFTNGQVDRMIAALNHDSRKTLWTAANLAATGIGQDLGPSLVLSTTSFSEETLNEGGIENSVKISGINGAQFAVTSGTLSQGTHYTLSNVPSGLTATLTSNGATSVTLSLSGKANAHAASNSVDMSLTFLSAAIQGGVGSISNPTSTISVSFLDPYTSYCKTNTRWGGYSHITNVKLGSIDNTTGEDAYKDFTQSHIANVSTGSSYPLTITTNMGNSGVDQIRIRVWADWNGNFLFEANEDLVSHSFAAANADGSKNYVHTANITIPQSAKNGATGLRVMVHYVQGSEGDEACDAIDSGDVEDYGLNISGGSNTTTTTAQATTTTTTAQSSTTTTTASGGSYCSSSGGNQDYEWIAGVAVGNLSNTSAANGGYGDFTSQTLNVQAGSTENITLTPGFASGAYNENWAVRIDFNQNNSFDDAGELVYSGSGSNGPVGNSGERVALSGLAKATITGTISIPSSASSGATRMRVSMSYDDNPPPSCGSIQYGEVEDYSVNISANRSGESRVEAVPQSYALHQVYPNPFNPGTNIKFDLKQEEQVRLNIYNSLGQLVNTLVDNQTLGTGSHTYYWNGLNSRGEVVPSGIYLIQIQAGEFTAVQKATLLK